MPSRIIREGINSSARVNALSVGAEVLYRRLMSVVDDYGRFHGAITTIIGACWPINPDRVKAKDISKWLNELLRGERPLVRTYSVAGATYIEIQNFDQQIRARSRFPDPPWANSDRKNESCVYFVQAEASKKIKIGFTELAPQARLATLQIGSPEKLRLLGTFAGSMQDERETHKLFIADNIAGEWFAETPELLRFIAEKCAQNASNVPEIPKPSRSRFTESESNAESESLNTRAPQPGALALVPKPKRPRKAERTIEQVRADLGVRLPWFEALCSVHPAGKDGVKAGAEAFERKVSADEAGHQLAQAMYRGAVAYAKRCAADPTIKVKWLQGWINDERWTDENRAREPTMPVIPAAQLRRAEVVRGFDLLDEIRRT